MAAAAHSSSMAAAVTTTGVLRRGAGILQNSIRNSDSDNPARDKSGGGASNSSTNQWTPNEKKIYITSLKKYGKNFIKIAENLQRRTVE